MLYDTYGSNVDRTNMITWISNLGTGTNVLVMTNDAITETPETIASLGTIG